MINFLKGGKSEVEITISTATFVRIALLTVTTVVLLLAINRAAHALILIFTAFFLALALNTPVRALSNSLPGKSRGSRALGTTLSFLIVILILATFFASIVPPLVRQTQSFVSAAPALVRDFRSQDSETGQFIRQHHLEKQVDEFSSQLSDQLKHIGGSAFTTTKRISSSVFSVLAIFVLTFMMLVEGPRWLRATKELVPERHATAANRLSSEMNKVVKGYVNGQVALAALASVLIMPAILLLHISYPAALMVIVFVCGLIPMVGHTIGAIIVTLVALFHSIPAAIIILAYYILYQQLENIFIQPKIQANTTNMSPLLVFAAVLIGINFGGLFGGLVAIPVAGCLKIVLMEYLQYKRVLKKTSTVSATTETK